MEPWTYTDRDGDVWTVIDTWAWINGAWAAEIDAPGQPLRTNGTPLPLPVVAELLRRAGWTVTEPGK